MAKTFDFDLYDELYPRTEEVKTIESAVDTFKPTEAEIKEQDVAPGESVKPDITKAEEDPPEGEMNE